MPESARLNHGQDVGLQTRELRQFAEARGWTVAGEYIDAGVSGAKDSRPELNRLMADAHKRRFDVVCVWRFDRFARSVSHLLRALETFKALGIDFVSFSEQMDTSTPAGKMVFTVLGAVAELERSLQWNASAPAFGTHAQKGRRSVGRALPWIPRRLPACEHRAHRGRRSRASLVSARARPSEPSTACPKTPLVPRP